jgi:peptidoglycan/LPS O-acetylase OafA/YrhL
MIAANSPNALSAALPQTRRHGKKRLDIQGLRTVAIMAVVAFHITRYDDDRQFFLNGNLGVDM